MNTYNVVLRDGNVFYAFLVYAWTERAAAFTAKLHVFEGAKGVA